MKIAFAEQFMTTYVKNLSNAKKFTTSKHRHWVEKF